MLLVFFIPCAIALGIATLLLLTIGHRLRFASRAVGTLLGLCLALVGAAMTELIWRPPPRDVQIAEGAIVIACFIAALLRPSWNPAGQAFFGTYLAAGLTYLAFGASITVAGHLPPLGAIASGILWILELCALLLAGSFAFEGCDVSCRVRPDRPNRLFDAKHFPRVSLHVAAYNEPPDMLIDTIRTLEAIDYPNFEIVVVDNNTKDPATWQPVRDYCAGRTGVTFAHVEPLPGYKSGALNLALRSLTDPSAEIIGVIDADYLVSPDYLRSTVGYFADPGVVFVQTPQDYREFEGDTYLTACYDAYRYFFATTMPSRDQRNSIIFAGTMGLLRRATVGRLGGWDEWCITEDAEMSLRMLRAGYTGVFLGASFGRGIMPLTFAALKRQRFRWCFGGMQILKLHWRDLLPWTDNRLALAQRFDYLLGAVQWMNDLVYLGFSLVLLASAALLVAGGHVGLRPLLGATVILPAALVGCGLLRALWTLRAQTGIGPRRAILAFLNWLSLSWTVALACLHGLFRSQGVFLRTPKWHEGRGAIDVLRETRTESVLALALWSSAAAVTVAGRAGVLLAAMFVWQGTIYASAPFMSWLNLRTQLSSELERRRRTEDLRERIASATPYLVGAMAGAVAVGLVIVVLLGGAATGPDRRLFTVPRQPGGGPILGGVIPGGGFGGPAPRATSPPSSPPASPSGPTPTTSPTASASSSPSPSPSTSPTPSPSASPSPPPSPSPSSSPSSLVATSP